MQLSEEFQKKELLKSAVDDREMWQKIKPLYPIRTWIAV